MILKMLRGIFFITLFLFWIHLQWVASAGLSKAGLPLPEADQYCSASCRNDITCLRGCTLWQSSGNGSCETSCMDVLPRTEKSRQRNSSLVNCRQGCDYGFNRYLRDFQALVDQLSLPYLTYGSRANTSVGLDFEKYTPDHERAFSNVSGHLQYAECRNVPLCTGEGLEWKYFSPDILVSSPAFNATGLVPYTTYKFRIVWVLSMRGFVYSKESYPIRTLEYGAPSEPPVIVSAEALSFHQIMIKWEAPIRLNGPARGYQLNWTDTKNVHSHKYTNVNESVTYKIFENLKPSRTYHIRIAAANLVAFGPFAEVHIITPPLPPKKGRKSGDVVGNPIDLIFGLPNELRLHRMDFERQRITEPTLYPFSCMGTTFVCPNATDETRIHALALDTRRNLTFISQGFGSIRVIDLSHTTEKVIISNKNYNITVLSYDWLNQQLYFVSKEEIFRCDVANLADPVQCVLIGECRHPLRKIVVDPINGYLFGLIGFPEENRAQFFRTPLALEAVPMRTVDVLRDAEKIWMHPENIVTFAVMYESCSVLFPDTHGTMRSFTCDGKDVETQIKEDFGADRLNTEVQRISVTAYRKLTNILYAAGAVYGYAGHKVHIEEYSLREDRFTVQFLNIDIDMMSAVGITGMEAFSVEGQPEPYPVGEPRDVELYASSGHVHITWKPPKVLPAQSFAAWNRWTYNFEFSVLHGSQSVARLTNDTEIIMNGLKANESYTFRVQALSFTRSGPVTTTYTVRTHSLHGPEFLAVNNTALFSTSLESANSEHVIKKAVGFADVSELVWAPDFVAVYKKTQLIMVDGEVSSARTLKDVATLAYDWIGRKFYWVDSVERAIYRTSVTPDRDRELVIREGGKQIVVDPLRAALYWCTDLSVEMAKMNGLSQRRLLLLDPLMVDRVVGISIDYRNHMLYALVQREKGCEVFGRSLTASDDSMAKIAILPHLPHFHASFIVYDERLISAGGDGDMYMMDFHFPNVTLQFQKQNINLLATAPDIKDELTAMNRTFSDFRAIPLPIDPRHIRCNEKENNLTISWAPATGYNYGNVQYDVMIRNRDKVVYDDRVSNVEWVILPGTLGASQLTVEIRPSTEFGAGNISTRAFGDMDALPIVAGTSLPEWQITLITCIVCIVAALVVIGIAIKKFGAKTLCHKHVKRLAWGASTPSDTEMQNFETRSLAQSNSVYDGSMDMDSVPRISRNRIEQVKFLGRGEFGDVFMATGYSLLPSMPGMVTVAVKQLRDKAGDTNRREFLKEACLMNQINHRHITRFLGVSMEYEPYYIVMEYMNSGDLLTYLRAHREDSGDPLASVDLLEICRDVAEGGVYLQEKKLAHRDLAARNCLVNQENGLRVVKIGDFGLARNIYGSQYYRVKGNGNSKLPVRWMAPESLIDHVFTTESDVWSYGIVMWEVMTLGQSPYSPYDKDHLCNIIRAGGNPLQIGGSIGTPATVTNLMNQCWKVNPRLRPTFRSCLDVLRSMLEEDEMSDDSCPKTPSMIPSVPGNNIKSESFPNISHSTKSRYVYRNRSSPDCTDRHSTGSNDSGVAVTIPRFPSNAVNVNSGAGVPTVGQFTPALPDDDLSGYVVVNPNAQQPQYLPLLDAPDVIFHQSLDMSGNVDQAVSPSFSAQVVGPVHSLSFSNHSYMNAVSGTHIATSVRNGNVEVPIFRI